MKRKIKFDAIEKHSKTPKRNIEEMEFSSEFSSGEEAIKGANRNSKQGRKGQDRHETEKK
ncbi:hypothetical protein H1Z61_09430 [Bacillus aquiflavi]|uniref:Uncharacterized protein n=1 Tax=Bacillus aquiflavi TaxID=2672567 RepID=A0A6B3W256_9BACI|nr:hypothetical protein [Bacillus aquiflavi]MBA4537357.1 hypothetical protein [Bacillus aquiflavi]NEY81614.1 hypothetical protein [Bacillus aquiflavi]UAC49182.1 hypothetical protein K6959_04655 [Bacillus aquiflavi]